MRALQRTLLSYNPHKQTRVSSRRSDIATPLAGELRQSRRVCGNLSVMPLTDCSLCPCGG